MSTVVLKENEIIYVWSNSCQILAQTVARLRFFCCEIRKNSPAAVHSVPCNCRRCRRHSKPINQFRLTISLNPQMFSTLFPNCSPSQAAPSYRSLPSRKKTSSSLWRRRLTDLIFFLNSIRLLLFGWTIVTIIQIFIFLGFLFEMVCTSSHFSSLTEKGKVENWLLTKRKFTFPAGPTP